MVNKLISAASITLCLSSPLAAQNALDDTWPFTDWIAVCDLGDTQTSTAFVEYGPEPGIYCSYNFYRPRSDADALSEPILVRQADVDAALDVLRFASELFEDWGIAAPWLNAEAEPAGVPTRFRPPNGFQLQIRPETYAIDNPGAGTLGYYDPDNVELVVAFPPVAGETGPDPERLQTLVHELFHAIQTMYSAVNPDAWPLRDAEWVDEGMADAVADIVIALYNDSGGDAASVSPTNLPLVGRARVSEGRYSRFQPNGEGLFVQEGLAAYDTSSFWAHLFGRQINDMRAIDGFYRAAAVQPEGARFHVDAWLRDTRAQSLPEVFTTFIQDMISETSYYSTGIREDLLACFDEPIVPSENTPPVVVSPILEQAAANRTRVTGMRVLCVNYQVDATDGPVTVSLDPSLNGQDLSPHLILVTEDTVLSNGDTITLPAGEVHLLRMASFYQGQTEILPNDDLNLNGYGVRFEQSLQSPCNQQTLALNDISNAWGTWDNGASRPDQLPEYGEAFIEANFSDRAIRGPACMRLILLDYSHPQGPALTVQLAHNPTSPYWGVATGNWATLNIHMPPGSFDPADLASGREIVFDQLIVVDGEPSSFANTREQFSTGEEHPFVSHVSTGAGSDTVGLFGHHLNESLTLRFEDAGQLSATGTFTFNTFGLRTETQETTFGPASGGGTFSVPITRLGLAENRATWGEECLVAMHEGRVWDAVMCARAAPDDTSARNVLASMDLFQSWFFYTYLQ